MTLSLVDHELESRVKSGEVPHVSPSLLNDADICLRRGAYHLTEPRGPETESTVGGTAYHGALETYYEWRKIRQSDHEYVSEWPAPTAAVMEQMYVGVASTVSTEVEYTPEQTIEWDTSYDETVARVQQMVYQYFAQGAYWPAHYNVLGTEVGFCLPTTVPGIVWAEVGHIDLIVYDTLNGHTILEDHKSAAKKWRRDKQSPRKNNQPAMYDEAWERGTGVKPDAFSFAIMTYAGEFERRVVYVEPPFRKLVEAKKRTMLPMLTDAVNGLIELPGNTQSALCTSKWCDYWDICPFGRALLHDGLHSDHEPHKE